MDEKSSDLLKLLNVEDNDSPQDIEQQHIICDLLRSDSGTSFPRPDQIIRTVEEAQELYDANQGIAFYATKNLKVFIGHFSIQKEDF